MIKSISIATVLAGIAFVMGFAIVDFPSDLTKVEHESKRLKPSIAQLKQEQTQYQN